MPPAFRLEEVDPATDFPELVRVMLESYEDPPSTLYALFCPVPGDGGPAARAAALAEHADRLAGWHREDPASVWHKAVDAATGEIAAAALWKVHAAAPFSGADQQHGAEASWYPAGGRRDFASEAVRLFDEPRARTGNRPQVYLNIIFTHPAHRRRGAADLLLRWGIAKAADLGVEMWLDAFPPAWELYPRYGFVAACTNDIRPQAADPDPEWRALEAELLPLTTLVMWRPKDGPFVEGRSVRPWEEPDVRNE